MTLFRIPLLVQDKVAVFEDLDLAYLVRHSGGEGPIHWHRLEVTTEAGEKRPVQWLRRTEASLVPGQRRGSLLVECPTHKESRLFLVVQTGAGQAKPAEQDGKAVAIRDNRDSLGCTVEGKPFVTYRYNTKDPELPRPYFHPLLGPTGQVITQLGEVPGKRVKHFHHTALWIAHQNFAAKGQPACDNWQIGRPNSSKIAHVRFDSVEGGALAGRFIERLHWLDVKGDRVLLEETRTVTVPRRPPAGRLIDVEIHLQARDLAVTFNRTPYHIMAARAVDPMLPGRGGVMTNSAGTENPGDGTPASWIDISGPLDKTWQGIALFNHPANFRQPTPCLQFARQTIGLSPTHREPFTLEPKQDLRLRYRVLVHAGNVKEGRIDAEYQAYSKPGQTRIGGPERIVG